MAKKKTSKGNLLTVVKTDNSPLAYRDEFETIYDIISAHKNRALRAVHNESLRMLWEVGAFVSDQLKRAVWGDGVVRMLADYIRTRNPKTKRVELQHHLQNGKVLRNVFVRWFHTNRQSLRHARLSNWNRAKYAEI